MQAAVEHQPLDHVARAVRASEPAQHARAALAASRPARGRPRPRRRAPPRCAGPRPNSGSATRKRPRFSSTATSGWSSRRAGRRPRTAALIELASDACRARPGSASSRSVSRVVLGPDLRLDALACDDRLAVGQVVVGRRSGRARRRSRAARPPGRGPCRTCACRRPSRGRGRAARRSRSRRRWRCRRPPARPPGCSSVDRVALGVLRALGAVAPAHRDDLAVLDEDARHEHALGEQAAAVAAQVEHDRPRRPASSSLSTSRRERRRGRRR